MRLAGFTDPGYFWLPEDEDQSRQVPGTLSVSESGRVTLETFSYFSDDPLSLADYSPGRAGSTLSRIFGYTREHGAITIIDALYKNAGLRAAGVNGALFSSPGFIANSLLTGGHFAEQEPVFSRITCRIEGLDEWLDMSGITAEYDHAWRRSTITFEAPEPLPFQMSSEVTGKFGFGYTLPSPAPWATEASVSQSAYIDLSTSKSWTTKDAIRWSFRMRDFLCLATDAPVAITSLNGYLHNDQSPELPERHEVSVFFESRDHSPEPAAVKPWAMSFRRLELGGLSSALTNWVDAYRKWPQPFNLFFNARYRDEALPAELQFLKLCEAMETIAPAKGIQENEKTRRRIERLAEPFAEFLGLDGRMTDFAKRVTDTRNFYVHHVPRPEKDAAQGIDLIRLSWQCEALLICHLTALALGSDAEALRVLQDAEPIKKRLVS